MQIQLTCAVCSTVQSGSSGSDPHFCCAGCGVSLQREQDKLSAHGENYYWGEIDQASMRRVIVEALKVGWKTAVENELRPHHGHLLDMIFATDRADWLALLPLNAKRFLDVGSGWAQVPWILAGNPQREVTSLEVIPERVAFQNIRKQQDGKSNITVLEGDLNTVDLPREHFDVISMIGVLEWLGNKVSEKSPRDIQLEGLTRACASLKTGGTLVIGIENRVGFNNFLGARDHSGLPFTSLLPRKLAGLVVNLLSGAYRASSKPPGYRTYTYTARGYSKLMRQAGFSEVEVLVAHPHYAHPRYIISRNNRLIWSMFRSNVHSKTSRQKLYALIFLALAKLGLAATLPPHFIIFARK